MDASACGLGLVDPGIEVLIEAIEQQVASAEAKPPGPPGLGRAARSQTRSTLGFCPHFRDRNSNQDRRGSDRGSPGGGGPDLLLRVFCLFEGPASRLPKGHPNRTQQQRRPKSNRAQPTHEPAGREPSGLRPGDRTV